jgi:hypothetical protein
MIYSAPAMHDPIDFGPGPLTLFTVLITLRRASYTGPVVMQFDQGECTGLEFPNPPTHLRLDNRAGDA